MVWCGSKTKHKDLCLKEIELRAQNIYIYENHSRLKSQHNFDELYDHSMSMRIFTLIMNKKLIRTPKLRGKVATTQCGIVNDLD